MTNLLYEIWDWDNSIKKKWNKQQSQEPDNQMSYDEFERKKKLINNPQKISTQLALCQETGKTL